MIRCYLNRLMGERRLKVADVVRDTGLPRSTITALWKDNATRIELPVLSILYRYFNCAVSELLEFSSDENHVELSRLGNNSNNVLPRVWFMRK
ncbi:helix-turn-helix domain-containing protein [Photorhabdus viridis]|uniref:helix-turn-helix domain-containing protein n=1 Tax=Photorhabdus viridis TaxID=3163327 RepID=UPI00330704FC